MSRQRDRLSGAFNLMYKVRLMLALHIRFRAFAGSSESLITATQLYQQRTRSELGNVRSELLLSNQSALTFVLSELYRDEEALTVHREKPYTQQWVTQLNEFADGECQVERLELTTAGPQSPPSRLASGRDFSMASSWPSTSTHEKRALAHPPPLPTSHVQTRAARLNLRLTKVEIGSAYDGALHLEPEPCLLVGAYALLRERVYDMGRALYRFPADGNFPCELVRDHVMMDVPVPSLVDRVQLLLLVLGVEQNGGRDIQALYQDLAEPNCFQLWQRPELVPEPQSLAEVMASEYSAWEQPLRVQLLREGCLLSESLSDDRWVGAAVVRAEFSELGHSSEYRFHLASDDRRNDWTAVLSACLH